MLTQTEARMRAAQLALAAVQSATHGKRGIADLAGEDIGPVLHELRKIEDWLRRESVGGDKILLRQLSRETGRQVKPTAAQARALGRVVKGRRQ